jgi:signal transduction histidine kinase
MVQQLRAKNAELDSFAYSVSHDLRAPLVSLQGLAGMLATEYGSRLDETGRHYLERIMYNGAHMERLLCDVLSLSRVGREAQEPEPVDLRALVDEILAQHADAIRDRGIEIVVHDLGSLVAVRTQVTQVLSNLIDNAIKYLGDAPRRVIEIGSALHDDFVEGWVRDTGPGIDPLYHEKIFEPFERLQEIEAPGTGLGLAIARKLVEGAGGRIWVESARHQGATFRFTWPAPSSELGPRAA